MSWPHRFWIWLIGESFRDARGRRVRIAFLGGYPAGLWSRMHKWPPDVHRRVRAKCRRAGYEYLLPSLLIAGIYISGLVLFWIGPFRVLFKVLPLGLSMAISFGLQMLFVVTMIWYDTRRTAPARARAILEDLYCPNCRYTLRGVPEADDGCIVCPECGAAWRTHAPASELDELIRGLADAGESPMEIARRVERSITEIEHALDRTASRSPHANPPAAPPR